MLPPCSTQPTTSNSADELLTRLRVEGSLLMTVPQAENNSEWQLFEHPVQILQANSPEEVPPLFRKVEELTDAGRYAAGFIAYEAGGAFDPELQMIPAPGFPLVQLAVFDREPQTVALPEFRACPSLRACIPELTQEEYDAGFSAIRQNIIAGDLYQANLTFRATFPDKVPPEELFLALLTRHPVPYAAFLNFGERKIVSLSPELFLESDGHHIFSTPMKGTAKRLPEPAADRQLAQWLAHDEKNRAENLMITDMVRNDLGRICRPGSITVDPLFHVDTYRTVHQMVSTVHGELAANVDLHQIMEAMFPPASITGAPKISAVKSIARNEKSPRKIYTGSIGCFLPRRNFRLNVAIRTLLFENNRIETGIGGGIVYDSTPESEWREALLKCRYATAEEPEFQLFETLGWTPAEGFRFAPEHLQRLLTSQHYFGRPCCALATLEQELSKLQDKLEQDTAYQAGACVKITLGRNGEIKSLLSPPRLPDWRTTALNVLISSRRVNSSDLFLYHKTSHRRFFDEALQNARAQGFHEVIFLNEREELTQGGISNLFLCKNGVWSTPALNCGLLPGVWRARAMAALHAQERHLSLSDLIDADTIVLGNSLRGTGTVAEFSFEN